MQRRKLFSWFAGFPLFADLQARVVLLSKLCRTLVVLVAVEALVCASLPYAQSDATSVSQPKEEIVTITVNIDAPGLTDEEAKNWKNNAESAWNRAFDQWPAECFKLHLVVKINPQPALRAEDIANGHPRPGHHLIYRASFARAHGAIVSGVKTGQGDNTYPLQNTTWGAWGPDVDLLQGDGYAHEVGHLMGLGDDYIDHPATSQHARWTEPKPGRQNTLMADGGPVDKQLVDRLAKLLRHAKKLPDCKRAWQGTFENWSDTTDKDAHGSRRFSRRDTASFSLTATEGNHVVGTAHLTVTHEVWYTVNPDDPSRPGCSNHSPRLDLAWDAQLSGEYQDRPDGTTLLKITGSQGPPYKFKGSCYFKGSYPNLQETVDDVNDKLQWLLPTVLSPSDVEQETPYNGPIRFGKIIFKLHVKEVKNQNIVELKLQDAAQPSF